MEQIQIQARDINDRRRQLYEQRNDLATRYALRSALFAIILIDIIRNFRSLRNLENVNKQAENRLAHKDPKAWEAVQWVRQERAAGKFHGYVSDIISLEVTVKENRYARYVESCMPNHILRVRR